MKKFSDIRALNEHEGVGPYSSGANLNHASHAIDGPDSSITDIAHPESIHKINAYLASLQIKPCIDPNYILGYIQRKLSIIGLFFKFPKSRPYRPVADDEVSALNLVEIQPEVFPISYMGGRFGVLDTNHTIGRDDGIRNRLGKGLALHVSYSMSGPGLVYPRAYIKTVD